MLCSHLMRCRALRSKFKIAHPKDDAPAPPALPFQGKISEAVLVDVCGKFKAQYPDNPYDIHKKCSHILSATAELRRRQLFAQWCQVVNGTMYDTFIKLLPAQVDLCGIPQNELDTMQSKVKQCIQDLDEKLPLMLSQADWSQVEKTGEELLQECTRSEVEKRIDDNLKDYQVPYSRRFSNELRDEHPNRTRLVRAIAQPVLDNLVTSVSTNFQCMVTAGTPTLTEAVYSLLRLPDSSSKEIQSFVASVYFVIWSRLTGMVQKMHSDLSRLGGPYNLQGILESCIDEVFNVKKNPKAAELLRKICKMPNKHKPEALAEEAPGMCKAAVDEMMKKCRELVRQMTQNLHKDMRQVLGDALAVLQAPARMVNQKSTSSCADESGGPDIIRTVLEVVGQCARAKVDCVAFLGFAAVVVVISQSLHY